MSKRSYRYSGYYIEVAVQKVGVKHFEGTTTIFASPELARTGPGPVHRCARMGRTREEAEQAAAASAESWAEDPGRGLDRDGTLAHEPDEHVRVDISAGTLRPVRGYPDRRSHKEPFGVAWCTSYHGCDGIEPGRSALSLGQHFSRRRNSSRVTSGRSFW